MSMHDNFCLDVNCEGERGREREQAFHFFPYKLRIDPSTCQTSFHHDDFVEARLLQYDIGAWMIEFTAVPKEELIWKRIFDFWLRAGGKM